MLTRAPGISVKSPPIDIHPVWFEEKSGGAAFSSAIAGALGIAQIRPARIPPASTPSLTVNEYMLFLLVCCSVFLLGRVIRLQQMRVCRKGANGGLASMAVAGSSRRSSGAVGEPLEIEAVDILQQFHKGPRAVGQRLFALLRGRERGVADRAGRMQVLGHPTEADRPECAEPFEVFGHFHRHR